MNKKDQENLKKWAKDWDIETIAGALTSLGIEFALSNISTQEKRIEKLKLSKEILISEIESRIKL